MPFNRSVVKSGDSKAVTIPDAFIKEWGIELKDNVEIVRGAEPKTLILKFKEVEKDGEN